MHLILKLHGTSGSGKTTVARGLMEGAIVTPILQEANRHHEAYNVRRPDLKDSLYILGPYTATCGGLDSLNSVEDHLRLLAHFGQLGHVFYEGLLGSEYYGRMGVLSEQFGDRHVFAFLDTPIELCLTRIVQRRIAAGNMKQFNPANTEGRIKKINRLKFRLEHEFHRPTVVIDHTKAVEQVRDLYVQADRS